MPSGIGIFHHAHDRIFSGSLWNSSSVDFYRFQWDRTLTMLYISYPVSWMITAAVHIICFLIIIRKVPNMDAEDDNGQRIAVQ